jgi:WD40 repeat protein
MKVIKGSCSLVVFCLLVLLLAGCGMSPPSLVPSSPTPMYPAAPTPEFTPLLPTPPLPPSPPAASPVSPPTPFPESSPAPVEETEKAVEPDPPLAPPEPAGPVLHRFTYGRWDPVLAVAWSGDGGRLAAAAGSAVYIYEMPGRIELLRLPAGVSVGSLQFHPGLPHLLAAGARDGTIQVWDTVAGELICAFPAHRRGVNRAAFAPGGNGLASAGNDAMLRIWDLSGLLSDGEGACPLPMIGEMIGGARAVADLAYHPAGSMVASIDQRWIRLRDPETQRLVRTLAAGEPMYSLAFSPDGILLAAAEGGLEVRLWEVETGEVLYSLKPAVSAAQLARVFAWSLAFHPGGDLLAVGSSHSRIYLWKGWGQAGELVFLELDEHRQAVGALSFSPDGKLLASGSLDGSLILWDIEGLQAADFSLP